MGIRLAILAALACHINAGNKLTVQTSTVAEGTEPEYMPEEKHAPTPESAPAKSAKSVLDHLQDVHEYVEEKALQSLIQTGMSNFLEVSSNVHLAEAIGHPSHSFLEAVISDDLESDIRHKKPDEKFISRHMTQHQKQVRAKDVDREHVAEEPPEYLPKELHSVFQQLADKYEENFKHQFKPNSDTAVTYLEEKSSVDRPGHIYEYRHTVVVEPQILLPVSANFLFSDDISSFQRDHLLQSALRDEQQRRGERTIADGNAGRVSLLQSSSKAKQKIGSNYMDPYPYMTPATVNYAQPSPLAFTPASLNAQQMGMLGPGSLGMQGMYPGSLLNPMAIMGPMGNPSLGVQAPPPPLRPDNLPPPPYISPVK